MVFEFHESNEQFEIFRLSVCEVCLHLLANGEYDDGTNAAEVAGRAMDERFPMGEVQNDGTVFDGLMAGSEDLGFSTSGCETCDSPYHGDRHEAFAFYRRNA